MTDLVCLVVIDAALAGPLGVPPEDLPLPAGVAALASGWPLQAAGSPEMVGQALGLRRQRGLVPALLWQTGADAGWLARALRAAGFSRVDLRSVQMPAVQMPAPGAATSPDTAGRAGMVPDPVSVPVSDQDTGADPTQAAGRRGLPLSPVLDSLRSAGLSVTPGAALPPGPEMRRNARISAVLPALTARLMAGGRSCETMALQAAVGRAAQSLPEPWPEAWPTSDPEPDRASGKDRFRPDPLVAALYAALQDTDLLPSSGFDPLAEGPAGLTGRRVTFVIEKLSERSGGAERILIETANALARRGHEVEILSHESRGRPPFYPLGPGVRTANLKPRREARSRLRRLFDMVRATLERILPDVFPLDRLVWLSRHGGFHRRLERHLAATRPEAVIAFMPPAVTALALARPGIPLRRIASMHNAPEQDFHNPARWDPSALDRRRRLELMARMDVICVLLEEYRDWYAADLRPRVQVVPNPVTPLEPRQLAGARRGPVVLAVGRLAQVKRHDLLIAAWARIGAEFPGWQLHIYGEGPLRADLEAQIRAAGLEESVLLKGHATDIGRAYLSAALLAHPAEYEGFPLAVTEALAAGLPVLGFADCSGLNRLVGDGVNGRLVPAPAARTDPDGEDRITAFARALRDMMADADGRAALAAAAPDSMQAYRPERVIDLWEQIAGIGPENRAQDAEGEGGPPPEARHG